MFIYVQLSNDIYIYAPCNYGIFAPTFAPVQNHPVMAGKYTIYGAYGIYYGKKNSHVPNYQSVIINHY